MDHVTDRLIEEVIFIEGGYVNDSADSGGETKYGITKAVANANGYYGDMKDLTKTMAKRIYKTKYWDSMKLTPIYALAPESAKELFDTGVNMGIGRAAKFLQRSLNALHKDIKLKVDGQVGPATLSALSKYIKRRGKEGDIVLARMLDSLQGSFYIELTERRPKDKKFVYGWFKNRVS